MKRKDSAISENNFQQFQDLNYREFQRLAKDSSLTLIEKIGFPNEYRKNKEHLIIQDILGKLTNLSLRNQTVFDIGCGCTDVPKSLIQLSRKKNHKLNLFDSAEMLSLLPKNKKVIFRDGHFPNDFLKLINEFQQTVNVILCYSVFHYVFTQQGVFEFFDRCLSLLAPGGQFLLGDIPNLSKRKRFFSSKSGKEFHKKFMQTKMEPVVRQYEIECGQIDDGVILGLLMRARNFGFDAYLLPQDIRLPMANRREDLFIVRP